MILASGRGHAVIDSQDAGVVGEYNWCGSSSSPGQDYYYAHARAGAGGTMIRLHQLIGQMAGFDPELEVDFRDRDTMNCRRLNLRPCTRAQNRANTVGIKGSTSPYKGVCWEKSKKKWAACLGKTKLGWFDNPVEAALAYDQAAKEKFGEFAWLNFSAPVAVAA